MLRQLALASILVLVGFAGSAIAQEEKAPQQQITKVSLQVDGNLLGRVVVVNAAGKQVPVRGEVSIYQDGKLHTATITTETGHFQATKVKPGTYTVVAKSGTKFGAFLVAVVAADTVAVEEGKPAVDSQLLLVLDDEQPAQAVVAGQNEPVAAGGSNGTMSGGGGGFPMAALLGLGGLGGLGGIGGGGGSGQPASPETVE